MINIMKRFLGVLSACLMLLVCLALVGVFSQTRVTVEEKAAAEYGSCTEHVYPDAYIEVTPATCSSTGVKWRSCAVCGYIDRVDTPKDPNVHSQVAGFWTYDPKPTCTEGGVQFHICHGCNKPADVTELPPDPDAHVKSGDYVTLTPATCASKGQKAYKCSLCEAYFGLQEIDIDPNNHIVSDDSRWELTVEPTCSAEGKIVCYCDNCGQIAITRPVEKTPHTPGDELIMDLVPTCSAPGSESYHCAECGAPVDAREIPIDPNAHTFSDDFTVDVEPTCSSAGEQSRHCVSCDAVTDKQTVPINERAHHYGDEWITTREPTCSLYGLKHKVCTLCGADSNSTIIPETEHTYGDYEIIQYSADNLSARVKYTCEVCGHEYITIITFGTNDNNGDIGTGNDQRPIKILEPTEDTILIIDYTTLCVSNVARNMSVEKFLSNFKNSNLFILFDASNDYANEEGLIMTGGRLSYTDADGYVTNYRISVTGDLTSDGLVTSADARRILRAAAGIDHVENEYFLAADVNSDGKITASDARKTLRVAANLEYFESTYKN